VIRDSRTDSKSKRQAAVSVVRFAWSKRIAAWHPYPSAARAYDYRSKFSRIGATATRPPTIRPDHTAQKVRKAHSRLFRASLSLLQHFPSIVAYPGSMIAYPVVRAGVPTHGALVTGRSQGPGRHARSGVAFFSPITSVILSPRSNGRRLQRCRVGLTIDLHFTGLSLINTGCGRVGDHLLLTSGCLIGAARRRLLSWRDRSGGLLDVLAHCV
jgi:hypothetical protein